MSKRNISYIAQDEPDFIKKFKQKVGYKEGPTIDCKRAELEQDVSDGEEAEDERPTVVVLKKGDLSQEEAERFTNTGSTGADDQGESEGKILFKKPTKKSEEKSDLSVSSSNKSDKSKKVEKDRSKVKKVKNTKLLSFNEDEEEEDE